MDQAHEVLDEAFALVKLTEGRFDEAELWRLKGEAQYRQGGIDAITQAEASFQEALAIARQQAAKSWELRATTSLARLWADQGKHNEAHDLLAPIYDWFTEGFETQDLKDAKAVLEELH